MTSIAYGMATSVAEVPICFRDVTGKILQPFRTVYSNEAVQPYSRLLCYGDSKRPGVGESLD